MRQHNINGSNVNGIQASNSSAVAVVVARDVRSHEMRTWKRHSKSMVPVSKDVPLTAGVTDSGNSIASRCQGSAAAARDASWPATSHCASWPVNSFEPPAAAWASLVIRRAISI